MLGFDALSSRSISDVERSPINLEFAALTTSRVNFVAGAVRRVTIASQGTAKASFSPSAVRNAAFSVRGVSTVSLQITRARMDAMVAQAWVQARFEAGVIARIAFAPRVRASVQFEPTSAFQDLIANPTRRAIYTIEISPYLLVPYEDQA